MTKNGRKRRGLWGEVWRRFKRNRLAVAGMAFVALMVVVACSTLIVDWVDHQAFLNENVISQDLSRRFEAPSLNSVADVFGRDEFGRSIFYRILWGTRYSIFIALLAIMGSILVGGFLGVISGYYGKLTDNVIMRVMDVLLAIPPLLLCIAVVAALGPRLQNLVIAIFIGFVPNFARIVRASILSVRDQEYVEAIRALGAGDGRIIAKHIVPNAMAPVIVQGTLCMAAAILAISMVSFLGLGIQPPLPEWGAMLTNARQYIRDAAHITVIPGCFIVLVVLALNLIGDGLRDALDPRLKN